MTNVLHASLTEPELVTLLLDQREVVPDQGRNDLTGFFFDLTRLDPS
jgi:hypothetical protein